MNQNLIKKNFNTDFKSHIIFKGIQEGHKMIFRIIEWNYCQEKK